MRLRPANIPKNPATWGKSIKFVFFLLYRLEKER